MSIIVDANCSGDVLRASPAADFIPILDALKNGSARLAVGGTKMKNEYRANGAAWRYLRILEQAGRVRLIPDAKVDTEEVSVVEKYALKSDDPHVLALARISGARLLCSRDQGLHQDFCNPAIISKPRGYIYQTSDHRHLIRKCCT